MGLREARGQNPPQRAAVMEVVRKHGASMHTYPVHKRTAMTCSIATGDFRIWISHLVEVSNRRYLGLCKRGDLRTWVLEQLQHAHELAAML
eukprot:3415432-Rhodomonas_salina.1